MPDVQWPENRVRILLLRFFPLFHSHPKGSELRAHILAQTLFLCLKVRREDNAKPAEPAASRGTNE